MNADIWAILAVGVALGSLVWQMLRSLRLDMAQRFGEVDKKFGGMDKKFDAIDRKFDAIEFLVHTTFHFYRSVESQLLWTLKFQ